MRRKVEVRLIGTVCAHNWASTNKKNLECRGAAPEESDRFRRSAHKLKVENLVFRGLKPFPYFWRKRQRLANPVTCYCKPCFDRNTSRSSSSSRSTSKSRSSLMISLLSLVLYSVITPHFISSLLTRTPSMMAVLRTLRGLCAMDKGISCSRREIAHATRSSPDVHRRCTPTTALV